MIEDASDMAASVTIDYDAPILFRISGDFVMGQPGFPALVRNDHKSAALSMWLPFRAASSATAVHQVPLSLQISLTACFSVIITSFETRVSW